MENPNFTGNSLDDRRDVSNVVTTNTTPAQAPVACGHQSRKSEVTVPVTGSLTEKNIRSTTGPNCHRTNALASMIGRSNRNSRPGFSFALTVTGCRVQNQPKSMVTVGSPSTSSITEGTFWSTSGASQRAAIKPSTTEGRLAMISIVGFTTFLKVGCMKEET